MAPLYTHIEECDMTIVFRSIIFVLVCQIFVGCSVSPHSLRPSAFDVWVDGGKSTYEDQTPGFNNTLGNSYDWSVGVNIHFDITYDDDEEEDVP